MLSRVASNLYWMGRYIERAEFLARYTKVQYFTMYEAPNLQNKNFVLTSIAHMTGIDYKVRGEPEDEKNIIFKLSIDKLSDASIYSYIYNARENARSARHVISDELWEAVNEYFIFIRDIDKNHLTTVGLYDFTQQINRRSYAIKSFINQTLLHETGWMMISLGLYLERTIQILRTLKSKLSDIDILSENGKNLVLREYQWTVTLKILEAFDIYRRYLKNHEGDTAQKEFIIYQESFPRSVVSNLGKVVEMVDRICEREIEFTKTKFSAGRLYNKVKYSKLEEFADTSSFIDILLEDIYSLHHVISYEIFNEQEFVQEQEQSQSESDALHTNHQQQA